jgi:hypothetical protein
MKEIEIEIAFRAEISVTATRRPIPKQLLDRGHRLRCMELIESAGPYSAMLTINFAHPYTDALVLSSMNEFLKRLNKKLFGRGVHKGYYLRGLVSVEVCRDGGVLDGCLHFHFLFQPNAKLNSRNAESVLLPKVLKILKDLRDWKGRSISNQKLVKASPYTGIGTLPSYLTKESEHRGREATGFIGFLERDGITGLDIPPNRKKRDLVRDVTVWC